MSNISEPVNPHQLLSDRTAVLATMHQKERVMAPVLERELGVNILVPAELDTDTFGTFTREVKRLGNSNFIRSSQQSRTYRRIFVRRN